MLASSSRMFYRPNRAVTKRYPLTTVAKEPGHRGARHKLLKPLRAGMPGVPVYSLLLVCVLPIQSAREAAGAAGTRHSPRPLFSWAKDSSTARAHRAAGLERVSGMSAGFDVIAATKQSDSVIPGRCQRVRATRGPMTGSASNPESRDSPMCNCTSEVWR
jgi:hypothetical protein